MKKMTLKHYVVTLQEKISAWSRTHQSITVEVTVARKRCERTRKFSPTGEAVNTMCRLLLTCRRVEGREVQVRTERAGMALGRGRDVRERAAGASMALGEEREAGRTDKDRGATVPSL